MRMNATPKKMIRGLAFTGLLVVAVLGMRACITAATRPPMTVARINHFFGAALPVGASKEQVKTFVRSHGGTYSEYHQSPNTAYARFRASPAMSLVISEIQVVLYFDEKGALRKHRIEEFKTGP